MPLPNSTSQIRRAQIVSLSLTELMLLLVFMAVAFSFLAKEEGLKSISLAQAELNEARSEIEKLKIENGKLERDLDSTKSQLEDLQRFLERAGIDPRTLRPTKKTIIFGPGSEYVAKGGPDLPVCKLHGSSRYLLTLVLLPGRTIQSSAAWDTRLDGDIADLAGMPELASGNLTLAEFRSAGTKLKNDPAFQKMNCNFVVQFERVTNDASEYDDELTALDEFFYKARK